VSLTNDKQYEIQDQLYIITNKTTLARGMAADTNTQTCVWPAINSS